MTNIVLSFDDGREDNAEIAFNVLAPRGIPATFNITTGYVDESCPQKYLPSNKPALTIDDVKRIAANPIFEIALHGDRHLNTIEDIYAGRDKLIEWLVLPKNYMFGFASPGSGFTPEEFKTDAMKDFRSSIAYMRVSLRVDTHKSYRALCRKAARVTHLPFLYKEAYKDTLMGMKDGKLLYSVPVLKSITLNEVKALVDLAINTDKSLVLMFHSIKEDVSQEDNWTWSSEKFVALCDYLILQRSDNKIQIRTSKEMIRSLSE